MIRLGLALIDRWTPSMAELVATCLLHPGSSRQEIAGMLKIRQATVSAGLRRAHFALISELDQLYRKKIRTIFNT